MNYPLRFISLALGVSLLTSCSLNEKAELSSLEWMLGKWESRSDEGVLYEEWSKLNDSGYKGNAYAINPAGDTIFSEETLLSEENGIVTYSVRVNESESTDFILVDIQGQAVFENMAHDFPQRIIYRKNASDSLYARIEGKVDGTEQFEEFRYVKCGE